MYYIASIDKGEHGLAGRGRIQRVFHETAQKRAAATSPFILYVKTPISFHQGRYKPKTAPNTSTVRGIPNIRTWRRVK